MRRGTGKGWRMVFFDGFLGLVFFGLWIFCIIDVITTPPAAVRNLPKFAWLVIVVLFVDLGAVAWLLLGRTWNPEVRAGATRPNDDARPAWGPLGGTAAARTKTVARPMNPDDDPEFLASLRERAEELRRRAREQGDPPPSAEK